MTGKPNQPANPKRLAPSDVCLLLRAHAETRWLSSKVLPVVGELEQGDWHTEDELGPALAYLEVLWIEACGRAAETDAARVQLDERGGSGDRSLYEKARRYHAAVRRLRHALARRVTKLLAVRDRAAARLPISGRPTRHRRAS